MNNRRTFLKILAATPVVIKTTGILGKEAIERKITPHSFQEQYRQEFIKGWEESHEQ